MAQQPRLALGFLVFEVPRRWLLDWKEDVSLCTWWIWFYIMVLQHISVPLYGS